MCIWQPSEAYGIITLCVGIFLGRSITKMVVINIPIVTLVYNPFSLMFDMNPIYLPGRHIENVIVT
jgi:hypothetical protein